MKTTTNHGLKKPDGTDLVNIEDLNYNADKLDGLLVPATTTANGLMSSADKTKLNGVATGANNYTHPATHPASMISGLHAVAKSGSYNDLLNKPSTFPPASHTHSDLQSQIDTLNKRLITNLSDIGCSTDSTLLEICSALPLFSVLNVAFESKVSKGFPFDRGCVLIITRSDNQADIEYIPHPFSTSDVRKYYCEYTPWTSDPLTEWQEIATTTKLNINTANGFYSGWTTTYSNVLNVEIVGDIVHVRAILEVKNSIQDVKINETALPTPAKDWWVSCHCLDDANNFNIYMGWDGFMYCKRPAFSGVFQVDFTYRKG